MKNFSKKLIAIFACASILVSMVGCDTDKSDDILDLTVWQMNGTDYVEPQYPENDVVGEWLVQQTGVNIDTIYGNDGGIWETKYSRLVAGDNLPHVIVCGAGQGPAYFSKMAEMDNIWELTPEIIKTHMPHVAERVADKFWENIKVDGKIYGVPYGFDLQDLKETYMTEEEYSYALNTYPILTNDVTLANPLFIREDILKKIYPNIKSNDELREMLNERKEPIGEELLDIPIYSTEEYVDFLYKIKDLNLKTETGKTVYAYGYGGADAWFAYAQLGAEMVGYKNHNYTMSWNTEENKIEIPLLKPVVKDAAKIQNKLLRDGVVDKESIAQTNDMYKNKVLNGQYAIIDWNYVGLGMEELNRELEANGKNFRYRPFYTQVPNREGYAPKREPSSWNASIAVLKTCSEEEFYKILNWIDVQFTEEFEEVRFWGPAEAGLYVEENGVRKYKDERIQKWLVGGDMGSIESADSCGLRDYGKALVCAARRDASKWNPMIMYRTKEFVFNEASGLTFKADSEHVQNVKSVPPCEIWSSLYGDVPEVVELWGKREQWEQPFIVALTAENDKEFEKLWEEAIDNMNDMTDINKLIKECTERAVKNYPDFAK